jgi:hypothetical protein
MADVPLLTILEISDQIRSHHITSRSACLEHEQELNSSKKKKSNYNTTSTTMPPHLGDLHLPCSSQVPPGSHDKSRTEQEPEQKAEIRSK